MITTKSTILNPNMVSHPDGRAIVTWETSDGFNSPTMARYVDGTDSLIAVEYFRFDDGDVGIWSL